jgi:hypothetical protein
MTWAAVVCACTQAIDRPAALVRMVGRFSPSKATGWQFDPDLQRQNSLVQPCLFPGYTSATISEIVAEFPSQTFLQLPAIPPTCFGLANGPSASHAVPSIIDCGRRRSESERQKLVRRGLH